MSWSRVALAEVSDVITGSTPKTSRDDFFGGDIPFVTPAELEQASPIISTPRTLSELGAQQVRIVPKNAVLVCCIGSLGKVGIAGQELATNQQINAVVFDESKVWPRFGYYVCRLLKPILENMAPATTVAIVSKSKFQALKIPIPPINEQKRIATILDQADELRRKRQRSINRLNKLGQSIFYEMFGDPETNPKGFEPAKLGEVIEFIGGSQPAKSHFLYEDGPDRVRFIQIRDFRTDKYPTYVPKALAKRPFKEDDVMIGRYGPPVFQIFRGLSGTYNVALMKAKPRRHITPDFIYYLLQEQKLHSFVVSNSERTAGQSGVNLDLLEKYPAYFPPLELLVEFSKKISIINNQLIAYQASGRRFEELFEVLQHRAFRGEL